MYRLTINILQMRANSNKNNLCKYADSLELYRHLGH